MGTVGTSQDGYGVIGSSEGGPGVHGSGGNVGVSGSTDRGVGVYAAGGAGGVIGVSNRSPGVRGTSSGLAGVFGLAQSTGVAGVWGQGVVGAGLLGMSDSGSGVHAVSNHGFSGAKPFRIDHPLDPENKYLTHIAVESPQMKNVYDGVVELEEDGAAWVQLPEYFEELNRDFCYQLSAIGAPAPGLYVAEEVSENRFKIAGGEPGVKVSWQITGVRKDRWAEANPIEVEQEKSDEERGRYLYPELYNEPEERGIRPAIVDDVDLEELRRHEEEQMRQMEELRGQLEAQRRQSSTEGQEEAP